MRKYVFSVLIFISSVLLSHPNTTYAGTLLTDNFSDGDSSGWIENSPWGNWSVENGEYLGKVTLYEYPEQSTYSTVGNKEWENYTFAYKIKGIKGIDKTAVFRVDEQERAYVLNIRSGGFQFGGNDIVLTKSSKLGTPQSQLLKIVSFANSNNIWYDVRIEVENIGPSATSIKVIINDQELMSHIDSNFRNPPILKGSVGLEVWPGGYQEPTIGLETITAYDDISVKSKNNNLVLNVPDLKQGPYNADVTPWADDLYDGYTAGQNTLNAWGCAVTSSSMVLNYFKHVGVNPGALNIWLKDNKGYNGSSINWASVPVLAMEGYTESNEPPEDKPSKIMFKSFPFSTETIDQYLEADTPVIVKLEDPSNSATHFVVVKGKDDQGYLINDPAYTTKTHLSDYPQSHYNSLRIFERSNTDLSYFVIYVNPEVNLQVIDPENNELAGFTSMEGPLLNQIDGVSLGGQTTQVFSYPTPPQGQYKINVSGPQSIYSMQTYLYTPDGDVVQNNFTGIIQSGQPDEFGVVIDEINQIEPQLTIDTTIADWDSAYSQNLIATDTMYKLIKTELSLARYFQSKGKTVAYENSLNLSLNQIKRFSSKYIDPEASSILQSDIEFLLNN